MEKKYTKQLNEYGDIMTVPEICEVLHVGQIKVYELLRSKVIKSVRVGRKYIVPRKALAEFIEEIMTVKIVPIEDEQEQAV